MDSENVTSFPAPPPADALRAGIGTWRAFAIDLPLRIAAETMRFTSRRLQASAVHLSALSACGSLKDVFELQAAFVDTSLADYRAEATTLSREVTEATSFKAA